MQETPEQSSISKPMTIQRIAETLGIHKSTVSLTLSGKGRISPAMRAKILGLAEELGYAPDPLAQRLASRAKTKVICLCSGALDPGRGTEKIALIQTALTNLGFEVPIHTPAKASDSDGSAQAALIQLLRRQRPQAIICSAHTMGPPAFKEMEAYQREGGIVVCYDVPVPVQCDQVVFDREDNAYQGAKYLLEKGHRKLGLAVSRLQRPLEESGSAPQDLRLHGFRRALAEYGLHSRDEWIFENATFEKGGAEMARHFLSMQDRPTGLCVVNDYVALAFMSEIMRAGVRVPEEVSMVGHDDQPIAVYCPVPLTSVSQPSEEIVAAVVDLTMQRIGGSTEPPKTVTIRGSLIERESVAQMA